MSKVIAIAGKGGTGKGEGHGGAQKGGACGLAEGHQELPVFVD